MKSTTKETVVLNMNMDAKLSERINAYRFRRRFQTRKDAIEFLLDWAVRQDPKPEDK